MTVVPIAAREAREISRRARHYHARWIIGLLGILAVLFSLWLARFTGSKGEFVFLAAGCVAQLYALFAGVIAGADVISNERREQTLGLLFLTDLKPKDVLLGKAVACATSCFFGLLALFPLLMLPMLMGGVSVERFWLLTLALVNTLFFSVACGFFCSSIFKQGWASTLAGLTMMLLVGVILPISVAWMNELEPFIFLSPTVGFFVVWETTVTDHREYWQSFAFNHLAAWGLIGITLARLVYLWRDRPRTSPQQKRFEWIQRFRFGSRHARKKLRTKLLDQSPLSWLANRDQVSSFGLLTFCFAFGLTFFLLLLLSADWQFGGVLFFGFTGLALAHLTLFFRICIAAAYQTAEERKSGALELLLSTPLPVSEILRGRWRGLFRQFFGPMTVLAVMHLFFLVGFTLHLDKGELVSFFNHAVTISMGEQQLLFGTFALFGLISALNWVAGGWLGLWLGLRCKSSANAVWTTFCIVLLAPWVAFIAATIVAEVLDFFNSIDSGAAFSILFLAATLLALVYSGVLIFVARRKLIGNFRAAAADRFLEHRPSFPWRTLFRYAAASAGVIVLLTMPFWIWRAHVNHRGAEIWTEALAEHPQFSLQEPAPRPLPKIASDENLAESPLFASFMEFRGGRRNYYRRAERGALELTGRYGKISHIFSLGEGERSWANGKFFSLSWHEQNALRQRTITNRFGLPARTILATYAAAEPVIANLFEEIQRRPKTRFPEFNRNFQEMANALSLHSIARLRLGEAPTEEILILLRIAEGFPTHYLQSAAGAIVRATFQPTFEGLAQRRWNDQQLLQLQQAFQAFDPRAFPIETPDRAVRATLENIEWDLSGKAGPSYRRMVSSIWPTGRMLEMKAKALRTGLRELPQLLESADRPVKLREIIAFQSQPVLDTAEMHLRANGRRFIQRIHERAFLETVLSQIQTAISLERFRLQHGRFPNALTELTPQFASAIPKDVIDNGPLRYRAHENGQNFTLYSVGWNGSDGGGSHESDWVWGPYPPGEESK